MPAEDFQAQNVNQWDCRDQVDFPLKLQAKARCLVVDILDPGLFLQPNSRTKI